MPRLRNAPAEESPEKQETYFTKILLGVCLQRNAMSLNAKWRFLIAGLNCKRLTLPIRPWSTAMLCTLFGSLLPRRCELDQAIEIGTRYSGLQGCVISYCYGSSASLDFGDSAQLTPHASRVPSHMYILTISATCRSMPQVAPVI